MSDLIQLDKSAATIRKLQEHIRLLEEQLEYFTDKYGLPADWQPIAKLDLPEEQSNSGQVIQLPKSDKKKKPSPTNAEVEAHNNLVAKSIRELLKVQINDLMELMQAQHNNTAVAYKTLANLKERLPTDK
jgi:hypothetical protein